MTKNLSTDLPTTKEELERKTFAEIENLMDKKQSGKITNAEYLAAINSIFAICSGLVTRDLINIITEAGSEFTDDFSFLRTRVFGKDKKIAVISRKSINGGFIISIVTGEVSASKILTGTLDETDTNIETEQKVANLMSNLSKVGYQELLITEAY